MSLNDEHKDSYVTIGVVNSVLSIGRCYIVDFVELPSNGVKRGVCAELNSVAHGGFFGPKNIGLYPPGTKVAILMTPTRANWGYILGAIPEPITSGDRNTGDWISGLARHVLDDVTNTVFTRIPNSGLVSFNAGSPVTAVAGSDAGTINEMGVGFGISRFFSWLRASDCAGLWCMYLDNLVRLHSHNFEHWHAGGERWVKNDGGEISDVEWMTPFLWEANGMHGYDKNPFSSPKGGGVCKPGQNNNLIDVASSKEADAFGRAQSGIPRLLKLRGFLGDIEREMVVVPEIGKVAAPYQKNVDTNFTGVLDIQKHMDGLYTVRSAKGILHEKYIFLPVPQQKNDPEEEGETADSAKNYKAAGVIGDGAEHNKKEWDTLGETAQDRATALPDELAYNLNYRNDVSLLRHERDWRLPEERTQARPADASRATIAPQSMDTQLVMPLPNAVSVKVDDREDSSTKYFQSRSLIGQLDDGSIIIEDGWGSYILLSGGNIYLSCPGDIFQLPGRNINMLAPHDIVARAGNSADVTAAKGDVRVKAQENLHMLAGNGGEKGSLMLESRVEASSDFTNNPDVSGGGIILKSAGSLSAYGSSIYLRGYKNYSTPHGDIIIDAGTDGQLHQISGNVSTYAAKSVSTVVGYVPHQDPMQSTDENTARMVLTPSSMAIDAKVSMVMNTRSVLFTSRLGTCSMGVDGDAVFGNDIAVCSNTLIGGSLGVHGQVGAGEGCNVKPIEDQYKPSADSVRAQLQDTKSMAQLGLCAVYDNTKVMADVVEIATKNIIGSGKTERVELSDRGIPVIGFTARNEAQYGIDAKTFHLAESRWQQQYRAAGIRKVWEEPIIWDPLHKEPSMPYPGYAAWTGDASFVIRDNALFSQSDGANTSRSENAERYADAQAEKAEKVPLQEGYLISLQ